MTRFRLELKIEIKNVIYACFFIVLFRPIFLQLNPTVESLWKCVTVLLSILSMIIVYNKCGLYRRLFFVFLFCACLILGTIRNQNGNNMGAVSLCFQIVLAVNLGTILMIERDISSLRMVSNLIAIQILADSVYGILNISRIIGFRDDITLYGLDNYTAFLILPLLIIKLAIDYYCYRRFVFGDYLCSMIATLYKYYTNSINAMFFFTIFIIGVFIIGHTDFIVKLFRLRNVLIISLILIVGVVRFHIENYMADLLISLGKSTNLSYRSLLWSESLKILSKTPIFGYGVYTEGFFQNAIGLSRNMQYYQNLTHAHNFFIDLYLLCGVVGFLVYILMVYDFVRIPNLKHKVIKMEQKIVIIGIAVYYLMGFMDGYASAISIYILFGLIPLFNED